MGPWSRCFRIPENPCPACPISVVFRKPSVYAGKTNPPPFTMRLCPAFVNGKTEICSVFVLFFQDLSQFPGFYGDFAISVEKSKEAFRGFLPRKSTLATFLRPQQN
jgi:hypothetical protein